MQNFFLSLFVIVILATLPFGLTISNDESEGNKLVPLNKNGEGNSSNSTTSESPTNDGTTIPAVLTTISEITTQNDPPTIPASAAPSVANGTTTAPPASATPSAANGTTTALPASATPSAANGTTTAPPSTTVTSTETTTTIANTTTDAPLTTSTTITQAPTTAAPGRKFDGLSFLGGMILVAGLVALGYLVIRYLRRSNRLPYGTLH